jgi:hypothetical protein
VDYSVGGFPLLVVGLFELVAINWIYGKFRLGAFYVRGLKKYSNVYSTVVEKVSKYSVKCVSLLFI